MPVKKRGLGRGLDALLTPKKHPSTSQTEESIAQQTATNGDGALQIIHIEQLQPSLYQPRKDMSEKALEELASSIQSQGVIQPIVVRQIANQSYEIVAGERRWRAAKLAKLQEIPCLIKQIPNDAAIAIALIENIQREDLNAIEEAVALQRLIDEFGLTHQGVADAVGKSRTAVSNLLRLNSLTEEVKIFLERGDIEMGHARALLAVSPPKQIELAHIVVEKALTVRETEALVKNADKPVKNKPTIEKTPDIELLEKQLTEQFNSPISIRHNANGKGKLTIPYKNLTELDKIVDLINQDSHH